MLVEYNVEMCVVLEVDVEKKCFYGRRYVFRQVTWSRSKGVLLIATNRRHKPKQANWWFAGFP